MTHWSHLETKNSVKLFRRQVAIVKIQNHERRLPEKLLASIPFSALWRFKNARVEQNQFLLAVDNRSMLTTQERQKITDAPVL